MGLRVPHYGHALERGLDVDWVEAISENFLGPGGRPKAVLERIRRDIPVVFHGVSMAIGSQVFPEKRYLERLKRLFHQFEPAWVSDHLCWGREGGCYAHELLPLPYTQEAIDRVCERVDFVQTFLGRPIALENVSSYVAYTASEMREWEFLSAIAKRTGCGILLDLNNILVSAENHGYTPSDYLGGIDGERIWQFHLANHSDRGHYRFDDHRGEVPPPVWNLFEDALARWGAISSLVEWDEDVPDWDCLRAQQREASRRARAVLTRVGREPAQTVVAPSTITVDSTNALEARLSTTQALFWDLLRFPTGVADYMASAEPLAKQAVSRVFCETSTFSRIQRLDVYANSYYWRLHSVVEAQFPLVAWILGAIVFRNTLTDYVLANPSTCADISEFGAAFPRFLSHQKIEYACDLAQVAAVEWAICALLTAENTPVVDLETLAAIPIERWPNLCFQAIAALALIDCTRDFPSLKRRMLSEESPPKELVQGPCEHVLVWRKGYRVHHRGVSVGEATALAGLLRGQSFGDICAHSIQACPGIGANTLVGWLRTWVADKMLQGVYEPE
ncbi:MAG: DUF692 family multinuclear iron-containing protein [Nannocystaceae bacterium]